MIEIKKIEHRKEGFMDLLLVGDEQESMVLKYLYRGDLFVLFDSDARSLCVVTDEGGGICEIKNLATYPQYQRRGYAGMLIAHVSKEYKNRFHEMQLGTGEVPSILNFYQNRGFTISAKIADFFTLNYDHPIIDSGIVLKDMIILSKKLGG